MQANREQIIASKVASHMRHTGISASTRSLSTLRCAARHECQGYQFSSHGKYVACEIFFRRIDKVLPIPGYTCRIRPLPPLPVRFLSSPPLPPPRPVSPSPPPPPSPPSPASIAALQARISSSSQPASTARSRRAAAPLPVQRASWGAEGGGMEHGIGGGLSLIHI